MDRRPRIFRQNLFSTCPDIPRATACATFLSASMRGSKFHLYWTGMNGSGSTGRTRACHRRAYNNLDAGGSITRVRGNIYAGYGREIRRPTYEMQNIPYIPVRDEAWDRWLASAPESENIEDRRPEE